MKRLPKRSANPSESRRANVLLEEVRSNFRVFGESLSAIRERIGNMEPKLDQIVQDVDLLKLISKKNTEDIQGLKVDIQGLKVDIQGLKNWTHKFSNDNHALKLEIKLLRDDVRTLSKRLETAEAKLPS